MATGDILTSNGDPVPQLLVEGNAVSPTGDTTNFKEALSNSSGHQIIEPRQTTHDSLNLNANIQVGNTDAANGNPVPVSDAGSSLSIDIGGTAPQLDDTDKLAVSLYGADAAVGDTALHVDSDGDAQVDVRSSALPTGAATAANQGTANTHLGTLAGAVDGTEMQVDLVGSVPAGSAIIGQLGIDQTTDGTTNKVQARNSTHGDFQVNATVQVEDADVTDSNPLPVVQKGVNYTELVVSSSTPVPVGSDLKGAGGAALVGGDLAIRDTNLHRINIPLLTSGYRYCTIGVIVNSAYDQSINVSTAISDSAVGAIVTTASSITLPSSTTYTMLFTNDDTTVTTGGITGADPVAVNNSVYRIAVPFGHFFLGLQSAGSAPTAGAFTLYIARWN